jgi:hypothetical protein
MAFFPDLIGTTLSYFKIGINGVRLKLSGSNLFIRNAGDTADAELTASKLNASGDDIVINSDAAGSGSDYLYTLRRPSTQTAATVLILPPTMGTAGQVLGTDGTNTSWVSAASTASCVSCDTTTLNYNSASSVAMFTLPANAVVHKVQVIIDTQFSGGTPTASVGYSGSTSAFMGANQLSLTDSAGVIYEANPSVAASGTTTALIITYAAGGASAGSARFLVYYSVPA